MTLEETIKKVSKLNKKIQSNVDFAKFCMQYEVDPVKLGYLCQLVHKRTNLAVHCLTANLDFYIKYRKIDEKLISEITNLCIEFEFDVTFSSLYPSIKDKKGNSISLPLF
jgi:hypothetical protein